MGFKTRRLICAFGLMCGCDSPERSGELPGTMPEEPQAGSPSTENTPGATPGLGKQNRSVFGAQRLEGSTLVCFYTAEDDKNPAAMIEHRLELTEGVDTLHARLTLDPNFVDNTYGDNAIGWQGASMGKKPKARAFDQLVGSDHAVLRMLDAKGQTALELKFDYISKDESVTSGYSTLGVLGGDGAMISGDASLVLDTQTSLDRNFNERGYIDFFESSPATDAMYAANPAAPDWEYHVVYDAWVSLGAFEGGFGDAHVDFIHASPSKTGSNTEIVVRKHCPPEVECAAPDTCNEPPSGCQYDSDCPDGELCFAFECKPVVIH